MSHSKILAAATLLSLAIHPAWAAGAAAATHADYVHLLEASKFIENYQSFAAVGAKVFAARAQGSDVKFARYLSIAAHASPAKARACVANLYATQNMTEGDVRHLIAVFESPLGVKLNDYHNRMMLADVRRGRHEHLPTTAFTEEEKGAVRRLQQDPAYRKYKSMTSNRDVSGGIMKCFLDSQGAASPSSR